MSAAVVYLGFQPFHPVATALLWLALAIVWIALLPGWKWKLAGSVVLMVVLILSGWSARAQSLAPPETNNCCVVWIAGSPWCLGWWC